MIAAMRVHLLQYDIAWEDKPANHRLVQQLVETAGQAIAPGDLIVLPEMFDTGFSLRVEVTADAEVDGPGEAVSLAQHTGASAAFLMELARQQAAWVIGGLTLRLKDPAKRGSQAIGINRALVVDPRGNIAGHYDKVHPFTFGREGERFVGGHAVSSFRFGSGAQACCVCPIVCYDLRFPELFRAAMELDEQPEVFAVIANWPAARAAHWRALCIARAIENQAYVVGVNRCGCDPQLAYAGGSIVVDPQGRVVDEHNSDNPDAAEPSVLSAALDLDALRDWRSRFPVLRDRRRWNGAGAGERIEAD